MRERCEKCSGPVFARREIDGEGNVVFSSRCWNGHIRYIHVERIDDLRVGGYKYIERIGKEDDIIAYIGILTHI